MRINRRLVLIFAFLLFACQPKTRSAVTILDNEKVITLQTDERVPSALLSQAGLTLGTNDRLLVNGSPAQLNQPITNYPITLQIRRAIKITINTPQGSKQIQSPAFTVGEVLQEAGFQVSASDQIDPPINSEISNSPTTIFYSPSRKLSITTSGEQVQILSSAHTVGYALAEAAIPLMGLDYSVPAENEPLPSDGQIKIVRVSESVVLAQKPIPFTSETQASNEIPLDQTQILQPGETGLSMQRVRIRYEDGKEISRVTENETVVRPPKTRILGYGTKVEVKTATVDGVQIEYWRMVQMYATSYSPCNSGVANCGATTASGNPLRKGSIGVNRNLYFAMLGQKLYIPGYGVGTIEDLCGGCVGKPWIDLGYNDSNYQAWHSWVTVYFLTPVPASIVYDIQ
jgi:uncharacterized protein YabE (DUF348 family)